MGTGRRGNTHWCHVWFAGPCRGVCVTVQSVRLISQPASQLICAFFVTVVVHERGVALRQHPISLWSTSWVSSYWQYI